MPNYSKSFRTPDYHEETIIDENGTVVGTIRIKPVSVLWKPKNARKFFSVPINKFSEWITAEKTKASRTKS